MTKRFSFLCSVFLFSFFIFSCAEVRTSYVSVKIPESIARAVTEESSSDTDFSIVIKISGDYSLEKSFKITKSDIASQNVCTIEDLPVGAQISLEVSLLYGSVAYYKTNTVTNLTLGAGENSANVELVRLTGSASVNIGEFDIVARYSSGGAITENSSISFNKEVEFDTFTNLSATTYIWSLNGTEISEQTDSSFRCTFSKLDAALLGEENIITCTVINGEGLTKISEFRFTLEESSSADDSAVAED